METITILGLSLEEIVGRCLLVIVVAVAALFVQRLVAKLASKALQATDIPNASIFVNLLRALVWIFALMSILEPVFGVDPAGFVTALGVVSLAISLGLQDTISNIVGGFSLMAGKVIRPGEVVTVDSVTGVVTDVGWRSTTVRIRGGAVEVIPNSVLSSTSLTHQTAWAAGCAKVTIAVAHGTNLDAIADEICAAADEALGDRRDPTQTTTVGFSSMSAYGTEGTVYVHVLPDISFIEAQDVVVRALEGRPWVANVLP